MIVSWEGGPTCTQEVTLSMLVHKAPFQITLQDPSQDASRARFENQISPPSA